MRPALFKKAHRWLTPFSWPFISRGMPILPLILAALIAVCFWFALIKGLFPSPISGEMCSHVGIVLGINTFFLGAIASLVAYFHRGLFPESKRNMLEKILDAIASEILKTRTPDSKTLEDFISTSQGELRGLWKKLTEVERLFHWTNRSLFCLVVISTTFMLCASISEDCFLWHCGLATALTAVIIFYFQMLVCLYPHWIRHLVLGCLKNHGGSFDQFQKTVYALPQEVTEFAKLFDELKKPESGPAL
jgi:hypothetical protein